MWMISDGDVSCQSYSYHKRVRSTDSGNSQETKRHKMAKSGSPAGSLFSAVADEEVSSAGSPFSGEEMDDMEKTGCLGNSQISSPPTRSASPAGSLFSAASDEDAGSLFSAASDEDRNDVSSAGSLFSGEEMNDAYQQLFTPAEPALKNSAVQRRPAMSQRRLDNPPAWHALPQCTSQSHPHPHLPLAFAEYLNECSAQLDGAASSSSCPLLNFFQLTWQNSLNALYCPTHNRLLPGDYVWQHIARHHKARHSGIRISSLLEAFLGHLKGCHPIIVNQSTKDLKKILPCSLDYPLSSNSGSIGQRYKCPVPSCSSWISVNNGKGAQRAEYMKHLKKHNLSNKEHEMAIQAFQPQWTEMVQIAGGKSCMGKGGDIHWFLLPNYVPGYNGGQLKDSRGVFESNPAATASELWPMKIGWCDELERIAKCLALPLAEVIIILQDLAQPPSLDLLRKCDDDDDVAQSIEHGLIQSNKLSLKYFSEGVQWVGKKFGGFGFLFPDDRYVYVLFDSMDFV